MLTAETRSRLANKSVKIQLLRHYPQTISMSVGAWYWVFSVKLFELKLLSIKKEGEEMLETVNDIKTKKRIFLAVSSGMFCLD